MKKFFAMLLIAMLCMALAAPALAASTYLSVSSSTLKLHPLESQTVTISIKNADGAVFESVPAAGDIKCTKAGIADMPSFDASGVGTKEMKMTIPVTAKHGQTVMTITFTLSSGKRYTAKVTVNVRDNYAPAIRWYHVMIDEKTGYPMIKLSMWDDVALTNVCFIREWTEDGILRSETYDIVNLGEQQTAVCYHTMRKPGAYYVQINDGTKLRFDSKALATAYDADGDGAVDSYRDEAKQDTVLTCAPFGPVEWKGAANAG